MAEPAIQVRTELIDDVTSKSAKISSGVRQNFGAMQTSSANLSKAIGGVAKSFAGLFVASKVIGFMKENVRLADVQAKAETQLATALGKNSKALKDQASALQEVTLFGDEQTIRAQALIAAFVREEEQIAKITPLVQDLAQAKGMDLAGAADLVSKTLGSSTNALARYGIQVKGAVGSTERLESLSRGLEAAFGGQAEAAAKAGAGPLTQMSNVLGDIREEIGQRLLPNMNNMAKAIIRNKDLILDVADAFFRFGTVAKLSVEIAGQIILAGIFSLEEMIGKFFMFFVTTARKTVELLPKKLQPEGWVEGLQEAEAQFQATNEFFARQAGIAADLVVESFGRIKRAATETGGIARGEDTAAGAPPGDRPTVPTGAPKVEAAKDSFQQVQDIRRAFLQIGKSDREKELLDLENWYTDQAQTIGDNLVAQNELYQLFLEQRSELTSTWLEEDAAKLQEHYELEKQVFSDFTAGIIDIAGNLTQTRSNLIDRERKKEIESIKNSNRTAEEKTKLMQEVNKKAEEEQKKIANINKGIALGEAIISTAKGVAGALSMSPPPLGIAMAILVGAMGAAQIALIASQSFAHGGIVRGPSTGDQVPVQANGGEAILTYQQQARLLAIADGRLQNRGTEINAPIEINIQGDVTENTTEDMLEALSNHMREIGYFRAA
jgi:hypothetical protein